MTDKARLEAARAAKREYGRKYRAANKERQNEYRKQWAKDNPGKIKEYQARYWEKKAACKD